MLGTDRECLPWSQHVLATTGEAREAAVASLNFSGVPMLRRMVLTGPDSLRDLAVESILEDQRSD